jgi:hypothetical protein
VGPEFAVSWVLTWFGHNVDDLRLIARVFDVCLAGHPFTILYIAAAVGHFDTVDFLLRHHGQHLHR